MSEPWDIFPTCWNCEHSLTDRDLDQSPDRCVYCDAEIEVASAKISETMLTYLGINFDTTWYGDSDRTSAERSAYLRGLAAGFCVFAWWKDGVQLVGSCGTKLVDAMAVIRNELHRLSGRVVAPAIEFRKGGSGEPE
jgi:hypothetical protein